MIDGAWFRHMARVCLGEARRLRIASPKSSTIALGMASDYRRRAMDPGAYLASFASASAPEIANPVMASGAKQSGQQPQQLALF